jgi:hypothetical protein
MSLYIAQKQLGVSMFEFLTRKYLSSRARSSHNAASVYLIKQVKPVLGFDSLHEIAKKRGLFKKGQTFECSLELATLTSVFLVKEMLFRADINFSRQSASRRITIGLLTLIVCDCAATMTIARFETLATNTFIKLFSPHMAKEEFDYFLDSSIKIYYASIRDIRKNSPLENFGNSISRFFRSNSEPMLEVLCRVFPLMIDLAESHEVALS